MRAFREGSGLCLVQESRGDPPMEGVLLPPLESETGMLGNVPVSRTASRAYFCLFKMDLKF